MSNKQRILLFPGKDTNIKRYQAYFKNIEFYTIDVNNKDINVKDMDNKDVKVIDVKDKDVKDDISEKILCHSKGYEHAINYCRNKKNYKLVVMDGVELNEDVSNLNIVYFCPVHKQQPKVKKIILYALDNSHYPYMDKDTRDKIIEELSSS